MTEDFYDLLEIPSDASQDEIKSAYRDQVRVYHPDLNDDDRAQAQFTAVKTAYDILGDPVERQAYDRLGHETYVAKRTSGLPSPDVWRDTDSGGASTADESTADESTAGDASSGASSTSNRSGTSSRASAGSGAAAGSTTNAGSSTSAGNGAASASAGATKQRSNATRSSAGSRTTNGPTGTGTAGPTEGGAARSGGDAQTVTGGGRFENNAIVGWWRRQNFAWPLIWLSVGTYLVGLVHYLEANREGLNLLWADLSAIGADAGALWETVTSERYGIETPIEFVAGVELVEPALPPMEWYGLLGGVVATAFLLVGLVRIVYRRDALGPVTINETIVVAFAIGVTTTLLGGPLLAGAALMPVLFGVIVYRTRQLPGWSPSSLYVLSVLAPAAGFAAGAGGIASLPVEFLAFVLVPLLGALGLPLRATIRKQFDR